jgi:hypothetical protein
VISIVLVILQITKWLHGTLQKKCKVYHVHPRCKPGSRKNHGCQDASLGELAGEQSPFGCLCYLSFQEIYAKFSRNVPGLY